MKKSLSLAIIILVLIKLSFGQTTQYIGHATLANRVKNHIITDSISHNTFILDSAGIYITAVSSSGKQLWKTDPWKDNHLDAYRTKRPIIVGFYFGNNYQRIPKKEVIWIIYNNTQFGEIDKKTGVFTFNGQD